ncbi:MAG TPA: ABC-F family ATP-binding cassette domain-containing protein [Phycisphaerales bacterium]|nr:ABC-F family ATP-binding cassette domain-containing protein [Phycisphaerales bacterium]
MPVLSATNIGYSIGQETVLDGVSLTVEPGQRIGLVGRNGCGKTTLLRVLAGALRPDRGEAVLQRGSRAGYLTQDPILDPAFTVRAEALRAFAHREVLAAELDTVFREMEAASDAGDDTAVDRLLRRQAELDKQLEAAGGYSVEHRLGGVLHGLGFDDAQLDLKVANLSGGQKGRLALGRLLLEGPDLLLLDEPTNHLDIAGRQWLEQFLVEQFRGAVVMVSHDRYLLDRVVHEIVELEQGRLIEYPGNYSAFRQLRAERRLAQRRAWENQQTKFRHEEAYIRRYKAGQRAKQAQGRQTRLEREKRDSTLERPVELDSFELRLPEAPRSGDLVVVLRGVSKAYPRRAPDAAANGSAPPAGAPGHTVLFRDLTFTISRGERWAIVGPNGAGKTTLVRVMLGQVEPDSGSARLGSGVIIGYYDQMGASIDPDLRIHEYLQQVIRKENPTAPLSEQQARDLAGAFLFSGRDQEKPMGVLSGGERSRARLAGLLASAKNLLVLDEPTNHLDIPSAERLEAALRAGDEEAGSHHAGFEGTLILISHDRALIDATCHHLVVLDGQGGAEVFHGTWSQWQQKQADARAAAERQADESARRREPAPRRQAGARAPAAEAPRAEPDPGGARTKARSGYSWMSQEKLEAELERVTARGRELDALMSQDEVYRDRDRFTRLLAERSAAQAEQEKLEAEWLRRAE